MAPVRRQPTIRRLSNPFLITQIPHIPALPLFNQGQRSRRLQVLHNELQQHNANEDMVSYDVAMDGWVPWTRYDGINLLDSL